MRLSRAGVKKRRCEKSNRLFTFCVWCDILFVIVQFKELFMIINYILSEEGRLLLEKFNNKFECQFRIDEPGNSFVFDIGDKTYKIPDDETIENFKSLILLSIESGNNLLVSRYSIVEYEENLIY